MKIDALARVSLAALIGVAGFIATSPAAHGQAVAVARISGHVSDASAGAVVGAQISATEVARGIAHSTVSDSSGDYVLPNLPIGAYRLEVKSKGFKDYVQ